MKSDEKLIMDNQAKVFKLINLFDEDRREKVKVMLDGSIGAAYFTAPASSREEFHSCYPGGLAQHSLNVLGYLKKFADAVQDMHRVPWTADTLVFVALFHDLGKAGDGLEEYYVPTEHRWKRERGEHYDINQRCLQMPTSERGLYLLQQHGITLSHEEYTAIRLNDGQYVRENEPYRNREPELALLLHWADMWATRQEKAERRGA